jgi:RNA polymerase sigma-32 factor
MPVEDSFLSNNLFFYSKTTRVLDKEEEFQLIYQWQKFQNKKALNKILKAYLRLPVSMARKFMHYGLPKEDLIHEGIIGIMHALKKFDISKDFRLSTYARWWIKALMQDYILKNWSIVKTGSTASQKTLFFNLNKLKKKINYTSFDYMSDENLKIVSSLLNIKSSEIQNMETRLTMGDQSLNETIRDNSNVELISLLKNDSPGQDVILENNYDIKAKNKWLQQAMNQLKDREKIIITARKLEEKAKTLSELGEHLKISKERVRQIESQALNKLRIKILTISNQSKEFFIN